MERAAASLEKWEGQELRLSHTDSATGDWNEDQQPQHLLSPALCTPTTPHLPRLCPSATPLHHSRLALLTERRHGELVCPAHVNSALHLHSSPRAQSGSPLLPRRVPADAWRGSRMAGSLVRIQKEYKEVKEAKDGSGITAELVSQQFTHWKGTIKGPVSLQRPTTAALVQPHVSSLRPPAQLSSRSSLFAGPSPLRLTGRDALPGRSLRQPPSSSTSLSSPSRPS